jgi:hypothetical protein
MAERSGVVTNAVVTGDYDHEGGRFAQGCRRRQMDGVQSTDGFDWKAAPGMGEDLFSDVHDVATADKPPEGEQHRSLLLHRDPARKLSPKHGAARFGNCDRGCHAQCLGPDGGSRGGIPLQQCRNQGTGFDVTDGRDTPYGGSGTSRSADSTGRDGLTLRHGHCQSALSPYHEGAGFQRSPPEGHRPRPAV